MTVEELIDELSRPMYNFRMARGMLQTHQGKGNKSAVKRKAKARDEIDNIVHKYVSKNSLVQ